MKALWPICFGLCVIPLALMAGSRSSASYSVPAETVDSGGRRVSSAAYTVDASIGGIGGISTAAAPPEIAKHSYIGQLYEASGVLVTASPLTINEGGTRQLAASVAFDDATTQAVSSSQVAWSVVAGPITSIDSGGLATADPVYEDTPATVRGDYSGLFGLRNLMVLNTENDNYRIYTGDGVDDAWQIQYFGDGNPNGLGGADPDGDGQTNYFEYIATTIPTNAESRFRLGIDLVVGQPTHRSVRFSPVNEKRLYDVRGRPSVESGSWNSVIGPISDNGEERMLIDTNATANTKIYKVLISLP